MSNDKVVMDYGMMRDMTSAFLKAADQVNETIAEIQKIAAALEEGALLGRAGDAFVEVMRVRLTRRLTKLQEKFEELAGDIDAARRFIEEDDQNSVSRFN